MKKITYAVLTRIPVIGKIVKSAVDPMVSSFGLEDGIYEQHRTIIEAYVKKHPDVQITRQLIEKIISSR